MHDFMRGKQECLVGQDVGRQLVSQKSVVGEVAASLVVMSAIAALGWFCFFL